ncbi:MAG: LysM peptidoglycan-binding domain-containing protein, partial [Pseudomonadota bacterium]
ERAAPAAPSADAVAQIDGGTTESSAPPATADGVDVTTGATEAEGVTALPASDGAPTLAEAASAPAVLIAEADGVRLLQPSAPARAVTDRVVVDVISYDTDGTVTLEGRGAPPPPPIDRVRVYLNNAPIDSARISDDGSWRLPLEGVATGIYTLRVDQLDRSGRVVSRFETPFKREAPEALARLEDPVAAAGDVSASVITVQPGFTLWGIASDRYGSGLQYVAIFEANVDQIRDPDLIYPGQVFDLPESGADGQSNAAPPEE